MIPFPDKKYEIIVVDPPWPVKKLTRKARPNQTKMDYPTMTLDEIFALDVNSMADKDCWLFLWTTQKHLFDAHQILNHWGWHYLLTMVWQKTYGKSSGMPLFGFRWNAEFVLVGYKSRPQLWPSGHALIPAVFQAPNIRHSKKPDEFYQMIERLGSPRIDLFARQIRQGWDAWGNEV